MLNQFSYNAFSCPLLAAMMFFGGKWENNKIDNDRVREREEGRDCAYVCVSERERSKLF